MDFLNSIKRETLIICSDSVKKHILKRNQLLNIKVMNIDEFVIKYCFEYDENAIIYLMKKYKLKYEIAHMYIKNLYYIKDIEYGINKLDFLVKIKRELDEKKLLKYHTEFKKYLDGIDILVYGIRLNKYYLNLMDGLKYKYIENDYRKYDHKIYWFETMEEEVEYVAFNICKLISEGVSVKKIKLTNVDSSYYNTLVRVFGLFGLKVNIPYMSCLSSFADFKKFINLYENYSLQYALDNINKESEFYGEIVSIINKYIKYNDKDLIIYKLEHATINSYRYDNAIEIIDYLDYVSDDSEYVFMLGFNDGIVPNSFKDIDYITDNIKEYVNLDSTKDKNIWLREEILKAIYNIKNLIITYKLRDSKKSYYPSSMCSFFELSRGEMVTDVSFSEGYNKIKLMRSIDEYIKYGYKNNILNKLYHNFSIDYNSYDNRYSLINRVMDKLTLSYSKMQIYNRCAFRYYLGDILKLDIFEENFSTVIGSMVHYVMEKCLSNNDMDVSKYALEFLGDREFSNKEKFFLEKYKICIDNLLKQVMLEKEYSSFDKALYEKKIEIDYGNNVKFVGVIDKILYKEENDKTYVSLIDYKTGNDDISLKYLKYGLNMQLPIYLYLSNYLNFRNVLYSGFYLQKFNITNSDYRLIGYSNSNKDILSIMDSDYNNSKIIKSMKTNKDGSFSRYTKVLSNEEIDEVKEIAKDKINEVIENIKNNKFDINPKVSGNNNIGCDYCKFKDICFVKKRDKIEVVEEDFGGDE